MEHKYTPGPWEVVNGSDLLTALIALREYLSKCPPHAGDTTGAEWGRVMDQSGAAIIKATGSQP